MLGPLYPILDINMTLAELDEFSTNYLEIATSIHFKYGKIEDIDNVKNKPEFQADLNTLYVLYKLEKRFPPQIVERAFTAINKDEVILALTGNDTKSVDKEYFNYNDSTCATNSVMIDLAVNYENNYGHKTQDERSDRNDSDKRSLTAGRRCPKVYNKSIDEGNAIVRSLELDGQGYSEEGTWESYEDHIQPSNYSSAIEDLNGTSELEQDEMIAKLPEIQPVNRVHVRASFDSESLLLYDSQDDVAEISDVLPINKLADLLPESSYCKLPSAYQEHNFDITKFYQAKPYTNSLNCLEGGVDNSDGSVNNMIPVFHRASSYSKSLEKNQDDDTTEGSLHPLSRTRSLEYDLYSDRNPSETRSKSNATSLTLPEILTPASQLRTNENVNQGYFTGNYCDDDNYLKRVNTAPTKSFKRPATKFASSNELYHFWEDAEVENSLIGFSKIEMKKAKKISVKAKILTFLPTMKKKKYKPSGGYFPVNNQSADDSMIGKVDSTVVVDDEGYSSDVSEYQTQGRRKAGNGLSMK